MDREDGDDQVPGAVRQRILHARQLDVVVLLPQAVDHVRVRVEADHPGIGISLEQNPRRLSGPHAELQDSLRGKGNRVDRGRLELVVARDLGPDLLQVRLRVPVELSGQGLSLPSRRVYAEGGIVDLERLALSSGQARAIDLEVELDPVELGGQSYRPAGGGGESRLDVSRTTSGFALRLRFETELSGPCMRCLEDSATRIGIDAREVDQAGTGDEELRSPYVSDGDLDVEHWANDALVLALPDKLL